MQHRHRADIDKEERKYLEAVRFINQINESYSIDEIKQSFNAFR
jgi:hypothetical protein